jgi:hypothetical protein
MPIFQNLKRIAMMLFRMPHPNIKIFNRLILNKLDDEYKKIQPNKFGRVHYKPFVNWSLFLPKQNKNNTNGYK